MDNVCLGILQAKVSLEKGSDGDLLLSYVHTSAPMMGISCGVLNQTLDDEVSLSHAYHMLVSPGLSL